jgi:hypothetical protein
MGTGALAERCGGAGGGDSDGLREGAAVSPSEGKLESYTAPPPHAPRCALVAAALRFDPPCASYTPCHNVQRMAATLCVLGLLLLLYAGEVRTSGGNSAGSGTGSA